MKQRRQYAPWFKLRVALEVPQGLKTINQIASEHNLHPDQVWAADITYVPMSQGFLYLVAILDRFSRFIIAWKLSNTLDGGFCVDVLRLSLQHEQPVIFNTAKDSASF